MPTSPAQQPSYADLLATGAKFAAELPDSMQFESDFANMAQSFIRDRAQGLVPYILGFEIVNRVPDGSKGVGVFVARIEKDYYYIPVFFLNGGVRGMDFIYSKKTNSFMPLIDEVISSIINRVHVDLGAPVSSSPELMGSMDNPDFGFMQSPGGGRKMGKVSDDDMALAEVARERASKKPWYSAGFTKVKREDASDEEMAAAKERLASHKKAIDEETVEDVLKEAAAWLASVEDETIARARAGDPYILQSLSDLRTKLAGKERTPESVSFTNDIQDVLKTASEKDPLVGVKMAKFLKANPKLALAAVNTFYRNPTELVPELTYTVMPQGKRADVSVVTSANDMPADAPPTERKRLVRDRLAVIDTRDASGLSRALPVQMMESIQNPDQSGVYNLLLSNGSVIKAWVLTQHKAVGGHDGKTLVIHPTERAVFAADNDAVFVFSKADSDTDPVREAGTPANRIQVNKSYVAIDGSGKTFGPFTVRSVTKDGSNRKLLATVYNSWVNEVKGGTHIGTWDTTAYYSTLVPDSSGCCSCDSDDATVVMSPFVGYITLQRNGTVTRVTLPSDAKLVEVKANYDVDPAVRESFKPTTRSELSVNFAKYAGVKLSAFYDPMGVSYDFKCANWQAGGFSRNDALLRLVIGVGLSTEHADAILDKAAAAPPHSGTTTLLKLGQVYMPPFAMPQGGSEQLINQTVASDPYMEQSIQGQTMPQMGPQALSSSPGMNLAHTASGNGVMDPQGGQDSGDSGQLMQAAQNASAAGQKSVFDHALLGSLSKTYDTGAVIDALVPKLRVALDALGRILFLYYWKQDDWEERFGNTNSGDTEDQLRSLFKQMGEITLLLEQKNVPEPTGGGGGM